MRSKAANSIIICTIEMYNAGVCQLRPKAASINNICRIMNWLYMQRFNISGRGREGVRVEVGVGVGVGLG